MAMHLWLGRSLFVFALGLFGLSGTARADHFLTHPAASEGLATIVKRAAEAQPQAPSIDAKALFQKGVEIKTRRHAKVYITPQKIPKNDRYLKAYSVEKAAKGKGTAEQARRGIAAQTYRTQGGAGAAENKAYSLADAVAAVWRKNTSAKLKTLHSKRRPLCANDAEDSAASTLNRVGDRTVRLL